MRVNLSLEESEEFRAHVRQLISGQVRALIREEMGGIVTAELTKIRLLKPDSPLLSELVHKKVDEAVRSLVKTSHIEARNAMHEMIRKEVSEQVKPSVQYLRSAIRDEFIRLVREMP